MPKIRVWTSECRGCASCHTVIWIVIIIANISNSSREKAGKGKGEGLEGGAERKRNEKVSRASELLAWYSVRAAKTYTFQEGEAFFHGPGQRMNLEIRPDRSTKQFCQTCGDSKMLPDLRRIWS